MVPLLLLLVAAYLSRAWLKRERQAAYPPNAFYQVKRADMLISLVEDGALRALNETVVRSQLEGVNRIIQLAPEGSHVKKGDLLVELDSSGLRDRLNEQEVAYQERLLQLKQAEANLKIQKSLAESQIKDAEFQLQNAESDLEKYREGDAPLMIRVVEARASVIAEQVRIATERLARTEVLFKSGNATRSELEGDSLTLKREQLALEQYQEDLRLIKKYDQPMQIQLLQSKVEEAKKELERLKQRTSSEIAQAEADLRTSRRTISFLEESIETQSERLANAKILAPQDGLVVYAAASPFQYTDSGESRRDEGRFGSGRGGRGGFGGGGDSSREFRGGGGRGGRSGQGSASLLTSTSSSSASTAQSSVASANQRIASAISGSAETQSAGTASAGGGAGGAGGASAASGGSRGGGSASSGGGESATRSFASYASMRASSTIPANSGAAGSGTGSSGSGGSGTGSTGSSGSSISTGGQMFSGGVNSQFGFRSSSQNFGNFGGFQAGSSGFVEEGLMVRQRQELIRLPDVSKMLAEIRVPEARVRQVRPGMTAYVRIENIPDRSFKGTVRRVALMPDSQMTWMNPNLKVYPTDVLVEDELPDLKPGVSARAEIIITNLTKVLSVPIHTVVRRRGENVCFVKKGSGVVPVPVTTGWFNDRFIEITEGLKEGDFVLLAPVSDEPVESESTSDTNAVDVSTGEIPADPRARDPQATPPSMQFEESAAQNTGRERRMQRSNSESVDGEQPAERRRNRQGGGTRRSQNSQSQEVPE